MSTKLSAAALLLLLHLTVSPAVHASGPVGIYGIVERVVFEPSEQSPERIRVFGAFALVDGGVSNPLGATAATRGYLYFSLLHEFRNRETTGPGQSRRHCQSTQAGPGAVKSLSRIGSRWCHCGIWLLGQ
jgi:hypothetical protein